ncbi:hypothetical protein [Sutcliffiella sp. NC1]|uniref:hypothetical protein n=1 Tax=Sutcliffiella sp. NC1 TaxID=3004096 RepID=UPI0022DDB38E|nr:hypothetical protein [Sutcliffiella sp. NC1]WBL15117.1 hypothetical protein O1A01_25200 [Sutcliffiella sp. NC1]
MEHAVVYLRQRKGETTESLLSSADIYLSNVKNNYLIKDIIFDSFMDRSQLDNFINTITKGFDVLIVDHYFEDEFDLNMINEISRIENFRIKYFIRYG